MKEKEWTYRFFHNSSSSIDTLKGWIEVSTHYLLYLLCVFWKLRMIIVIITVIFIFCFIATWFDDNNNGDDDDDDEKRRRGIMFILCLSVLYGWQTACLAEFNRFVWSVHSFVIKDTTGCHDNWL